MNYQVVIGTVFQENTLTHLNDEDQDEHKYGQGIYVLLSVFCAMRVDIVVGESAVVVSVIAIAEDTRSVSTPSVATRRSKGTES